MATPVTDMERQQPYGPSGRKAPGEEERGGRLPALDKEPPGQVTIARRVIEKIAGVAAREIHGIHPGGPSAFPLLRGAGAGPANGVKARLHAGRDVYIDLTLRAEYGEHIPTLVSQARRNISEKIGSMTGLTTREIRVRVVDIVLPEDRTGDR